jgi:hypothetical protein
MMNLLVNRIFLFMSCTLLVVSFALQATTTQTTIDNLDNAGTSTPDEDMGANSGNVCIFSNSPLHPIEFTIDGSTPASSAYLIIQARDIDWPDEQNSISFNNKVVGATVGENFAAVDGKSHTTLIELPILDVLATNRIEINVDIGNQLDPVWCADIQKGKLIIDDDGTNTGTANISGLSTDHSSYSALETVSATIELLSIAPANQSVNLELTVRDANNNIVQFESQQDLPLTFNNPTTSIWTFEAPAASVDTTWTLYAVLYDAATGDFEGLKKVNFSTIGATTSVPAPIVASLIPDFAIEDADNNLTIKGENFILDGTSCTIGTVTLSNQKTIDNQSHKGTLPANSLANGSYSVRCTTASGVSNTLTGFIVAEAVGGSTGGGSTGGGGSNSAGDNSSNTGGTGSTGTTSRKKKSSGGCAIGDAQATDPTLWLLLLVSLIYVARHHRLKKK